MLIGCRVWCGGNGFDHVDEALRVICDRLDALVIVCDAVSDDRATEAFDTAGHTPVPATGRVTGSVSARKGALESTTRDEVPVPTENRPLFDEIVDMMRHRDETDGVCQFQSPDVAATVGGRCRTEPIRSNEYSDDPPTDVDRVSDSTEANSSHDSSYTTCNGCSPRSGDSASPSDRRRRSVFDEIAVDFPSNADDDYEVCRRSNVTVDEPASAEDAATDRRSEDCRVQSSRNAGVFSGAEQSRRSALETLSRKEQTLLQQQQRSNSLLHAELVRLTDDNRQLQSIVAELTASRHRKNSEVSPVRIGKRSKEMARR